MFTEPITITLVGGAKALARTPGSDTRGVFQLAAEGLKFTITQTVTAAKRARRVVRLDYSGISTDPLIAGVSRPTSGSISVTTDFPLQGMSTSQQEDLLKALATWLSVQGNRDKFLNGEA